MGNKDIKETAKELKDGIKAGIAENRETIREVTDELKKLHGEIRESDEVKQLRAKKEAVLMEGKIKKEKVEADIRQLKEKAELKAQVMRETAETKKSKEE